jgi:mono/diheme cytochrome c family protein
VPAFGGELSKEDIWAIVAWIRSHKAQAPGELAPRARKP